MRIAGPNSDHRFRSPPSREEPISERTSEPQDFVQATSKEEQDGLSGWQKAGLGAMAVVGVVTSLSGAAGVAARKLPVCEAESGWVDVQSGEICVSAELSTSVDAIHRTVRGELYYDEAVDSLVSRQNQVLQPGTPAVRPPDGEFTVNSWNLHHGTSPNSTGARNQLDTQIAELLERDADVDLLQEILPWHAQQIVDATGKVGYYSQTTPRQGNLILVSPDLVVTENARLTLNHQIENRDDATDVVRHLKGKEPRAAQFLHLVGADTNGQTVAVFNTHLSTGTATPDDRAAEHRVLERLVDEHRELADVLVGGGDLNTRDGREIVKTFRDKGLSVEGASIDWLVSDHAGESRVRRVDVRTEDGSYVSDHPLVEGRYQIDR
ncbi:MAG: endonuclease/exonuclease/phosphatase family protein [Vulcanimicrobiota bacterium]